MSKKKFTEGLERVFGDLDEASGGDERVIFIEEEEEKPQPEKEAGRRKRSSSRKNFISDLDSLLSDALEDALDDQPTPEGGQSKKEDNKAVKPWRTKAPRKTLSGLDALIRQTVRASKVEVNRYGKVRRVTFTFNEEHLEKLKKIARQEKVYLKDIIQDIVEEFIREYEQKKGTLN